MAVTIRRPQMTPNTWKLMLLFGIIISWFLGVFLFIIAVLLVVGVFGNGYPTVIEVMNCDSPNAAVSCARVYGYRSEGVVVFILSFFCIGWAVVFTLAFFMKQSFKQGVVLSKPPPTFGVTPGHAHVAQFATSQA